MGLHYDMELSIAYEQILKEDILQTRNHGLLNAEIIHLAQQSFRLGVRQPPKRPLADVGIAIYHGSPHLVVVWNC